MRNASVISVEKLSPSLFLIKLKAEGGLSFKAGQRVSVSTEAAQPGLGIYSIASAEGSDPFEVIVESGRSAVSSWICGRKAGELLAFEGPAGEFSLADPPLRTQIFLGSGAGLAPLRSMILTLTQSAPAQHLHLFLGAQGSTELIFDAEWRALAASSDKFHYHPVVRPSADNPFFGKNQDPADELCKKMAHRTGHDIYLAGFNQDVEPMRAKLEAAGFEKAFIRVESFG
jgi:ferredoxin-NADP reductase